MATSYFDESEAPRSFRVSSTDSKADYTKCPLCYTVRRNFYCRDCIRAGNFVQSSMPYSDRFAEKQVKLERLQANRQHVLDRCEKLMSSKFHKDTLYTDTKRSRDRTSLIRLSIEQRKEIIKEKQKKLKELINFNNDLRTKTPRYQKRVSMMAKHEQNLRIELENKKSVHNDLADKLAALRRSRVRQLNKYIFPMYMTYDCSDSIDDLEFLGEVYEGDDVPKKLQLHIVGPWINADEDFSNLKESLSAMKQSGWCPAEDVSGGAGAAARAAAALGLAAQLVLLLSNTLDVNLPYSLCLSEYLNSVSNASPRLLSRRARRLWAAVGALARAAALPPPPPRAPLAALDDLCTAAAADCPDLGRSPSSPAMPATALGGWDAWWEAACADCEDAPEDEPPEHLVWPEAEEMDELSCTPPTPVATSLVSSAATSLMSMWRGWNK